MTDPRPQQARRVFEGVKFAVDQVQVPTPDGRTVDRDLVVHPGAVVILATLDDGRVLMIRNRRFAVGKTLWELPAGTLEDAEDPAACAGRELAEETGYRAATIEPLCTFYTTPGICTEKMHAYLATGLSHVGQDLEDDEHIEVHAVAWDDLLAMVRDGDVEDGKTIAAILYYAAFKRPAA